MIKWRGKYVNRFTNKTVRESCWFDYKEDAMNWIPDNPSELVDDETNSLLHSLQFELESKITDTHLLITIYDDRDGKVIQEATCNDYSDAYCIIDRIYGEFTDPDDGVRPTHLTHKIEEVADEKI